MPSLVLNTTGETKKLKNNMTQPSSNFELEGKRKKNIYVDRSQIFKVYFSGFSLGLFCT